MSKRLELALPLHHHHVGRRARSVFAVGQVEKTAWGQAVRRFKHRVPRPRRKCDEPPTRPHFCREAIVILPMVRLSGESSMIIAMLDRCLAKQQPEGTFESPLCIVAETMLTRGEKIATLERWRQAILRGLVAVHEVERKRFLTEIEEARSRLGTFPRRPNS